MTLPLHALITLPYNAIEAMLLTKQLSFSKHAGVIAAFNQHFIKPGVFPKEFSKMLERLFRNRQTGDYAMSPHSVQKRQTKT